MTITAHDITVSVPRTWTSRSDPAHGVVVAARARELPASSFAPEIVVRTVPVDDDLVCWRADALATLAAQLAAFDLEDEDEFEIEGQSVVYHRFAHRIGLVDVLAEQWSWLVGGVGITLTGSVAREDYLAYGDLFEQVAETLGFTTGTAA